MMMKMMMIDTPKKNSSKKEKGCIFSDSSNEFDDDDKVRNAKLIDWIFLTYCYLKTGYRQSYLHSSKSYNIQYFVNTT